MSVCSIGVDAGSTTLKIVGIDKDKHIVFSIVEQADPRIELQAKEKIEQLSSSYNIGDVPLVATGYGSELIKWATKRATEITCHARGVFESLGTNGTIVDIGGQDSKVIVIDKRGNVIDFVMNDKCAAGTGRFLETSAWRLKIPIEKMSEIALAADSEVSISSTCAVFAESEVISKLAHGEKLEAVIRGLHRSLVKRVIAMVYTVGFVEPLILSGGVVQNKAIQEMIREELKTTPIIPDNPQIMGAYGAAVIGLDA